MLEKKHLTSDDQNPHLYQDSLGKRSYTLDSLLERIEDQFRQETSNRTDILSELDTRQKRIEHVREVADYVLATEYVNLAAPDKRELVEEAVARLFYFGVIDKYLRDETITEITISGMFGAHIRREFGEMEAIGSPFKTFSQFQDTLQRLLAPTGVILTDENPFVEVGLLVHDRPVRFTYAGPPVNSIYSLEMRLHPAKSYTLDGLTPEPLPEIGRELVQQIMDTQRGLIITGEVGVGKTSLLAALLAMSDHGVVVQRAAEMVLPESVKASTGQYFDEVIQDTLKEHAPICMALDEIRGDENDAFWKVLTSDVKQLLVAFRGTSDAARLYSALKIGVLKGNPSIQTTQFDSALLQKLPFVLVLHQPRGEARPRVTQIGQWVVADGRLVVEPLMTWKLGEDPIRTDAAMQ